MHRPGHFMRKPSDVGSYEFPPGTDMRPNIDDFFDIYGPSSLRSANRPEEEYTYVHTFGKTQRKRLRHNLSKNGGALVSGYSINDPVVLAAEKAVMYPGATDRDADYFDFTEGVASRFVDKTNYNAGIPTRSGMAAAGSTTGELLYKPSTNVPPRNNVASLTHKHHPGMNETFLPPPPVPTDNKKFSNHQLVAVDPRAHASQYVPVSQVQMVPLSVSGSKFGNAGAGNRFTGKTDTHPQYFSESVGSEFAQTSPSMGCGFPSAALTDSEPQMVVQGEFSTFDTPPNVVQNIHSPFLRNTSMGQHNGSQAGVFIPYQKPLALPSRGGHFVSLENYMQEPWTSGVEGLGV